MIEQLQTRPFSSIYYMIANPKPKEPFDLEKVINDVCAYLGADRAKLYERCRVKEVKFSRWLIWAIMRTNGYSVLQCGSLFLKDHSTVVHAMDNLPNDLKENDWLRIANDKLEKHYGTIKALRYNKNQVAKCRF